MADTAIRLLRSLDSENQELPRLEELKTQAEHRARERSAQRNAECPVFSVFTGAKTVPAWTDAMPADATLTTGHKALCPPSEPHWHTLRRL